MLDAPRNAKAHVQKAIIVRVDTGERHVAGYGDIHYALARSAIGTHKDVTAGVIVLAIDPRHAIGRADLQE